MNSPLRLVFRSHAIRRIFQRGIDIADIRHVIETGEVIEARPDDLPYPSRLVLGSIKGRHLHVVLASDEQAATTIVVTVYEPDPALWRPGFRKRRKP
ncbi:MAG: DUF4258 domain-containing protein [Geminicoccaceae bacterium]